MKLKNYIIAFISLLVVGVVIIYYIRARHRIGPDKPSSGAESIDNPVYVTAVIADRDTLIQHIKTSGYAKSVKKINLSAQVSGYIKALYVKDGDYVQRNEILVVIDSVSYLLQFQKRRSAFLKSLGEFIQELKLKNSPDLARWENYFRTALSNTPIPELPYILSQPLTPQPTDANEVSAANKLAPKANNYPTPEYLTLARYNIPSLYYDLKSAEENLEECRIKAPFSGYISSLKVVEGAFVHPNQEILTLTNLDTMKVEIEILEDDINYIHIGNEFEILAENDSKIKGNIQGIDPTIDKEKRIGKAYAFIPNPRHRLKDGQFLSIRLVKRRIPDISIVPLQAVLNRNDRDLVFRVENGLAKWCYVKTGERNDKFIEIKSGISEGDTIIVSGHYSLAHNSKVKVTLSAPP